MIVTVEVEKRKLSLLEVETFQYLVSGGRFYRVLIERNVYLFPCFDVLQTFSVPDGAEWFTSSACRVTKSCGRVPPILCPDPIGVCRLAICICMFGVEFGELPGVLKYTGGVRTVEFYGTEHERRKPFGPVGG